MFLDDFRLTSIQYTRLSHIKASLDQGIKTDSIDNHLKERKLVSVENGMTYITSYASRNWSHIRIK